MASPPDPTTGSPPVPDRSGPVEWGCGSLFAQDFLNGPLESSEAWQALTAAELAAVGATLREVVNRFPRQHEPSEATTEDELIWPVLRSLGWRDVLRQQRLSSHGREDVPDGLLFADAAAKDSALAQAEDWQRYQHGAALVESKRWGLNLDRGSPTPSRRHPQGPVPGCAPG